MVGVSLVDLPLDLLVAEIASLPRLDPASCTSLALASKSLYKYLRNEFTMMGRNFAYECIRYGQITLFQFALSKARRPPRPKDSTKNTYPRFSPPPGLPSPSFPAQNIRPFARSNAAIQYFPITEDDFPQLGYLLVEVVDRFSEYYTVDALCQLAQLVRRDTNTLCETYFKRIFSMALSREHPSRFEEILTMVYSMGHSNWIDSEGFLVILSEPNLRFVQWVSEIALQNRSTNLPRPIRDLIFEYPLVRNNSMPVIEQNRLYNKVVTAALQSGSVEQVRLVISMAMRPIAPMGVDTLLLRVLVPTLPHITRSRGTALLHWLVDFEAKNLGRIAGSKKFSEGLFNFLSYSQNQDLLCEPPLSADVLSLLASHSDWTPIKPLIRDSVSYALFYRDSKLLRQLIPWIHFLSGDDLMAAMVGNLDSSKFDRRYPPVLLQYLRASKRREFSEIVLLILEHFPANCKSLLLRAPDPKEPSDISSNLLVKDGTSKLVEEVAKRFKETLDADLLQRVLIDLISGKELLSNEPLEIIQVLFRLGFKVDQSALIKHIDRIERRKIICTRNSLQLFQVLKEHFPSLFEQFVKPPELATPFSYFSSAISLLGSNGLGEYLDHPMNTVPFRDVLATVKFLIAKCPPKERPDLKKFFVEGLERSKLPYLIDFANTEFKV